MVATAAQGRAAPRAGGPRARSLRLRDSHSGERHAISQRPDRSTHLHL